jgi:hypothetical protein
MNLSIVVRAYNEAEHIEGTIVPPGVTLAEGAGVGALSLVLELEGKLRREGTDPGV